MTATLMAAYGRRYKTKEQAINDYKGGKDFQFTDVQYQDYGRYCSCRDYNDQEVRLKYGSKNEHTALFTWRK